MPQDLHRVGKDAERRQLTVHFCDRVTHVAARLHSIAEPLTVLLPTERRA